MGLGDSSKPVFCRLQGKRANLNTEIRKQSLPNFPKNEHFLPPGTHTYVCVSEGKKCSFFGSFLLLRFEIQPFTLLPTIYKDKHSFTEIEKLKIIPEL